MCVVSDGSDFRRRVVVYCNSTVSVTTRVSCVRLCVEAIISHLAIGVRMYGGAPQTVKVCIIFRGVPGLKPHT